jgi:hypothetical protein
MTLPQDTALRDRALRVAHELRACGCYHDADRLRTSVRMLERQRQMLRIGHDVLAQLVEDSEAQLRVMGGPS